MKKRPVIGVTVTVLVLSVIIGIATLPDEVLIDSSAIQSSQTTPTDNPTNAALKESQDIISNAIAQQKMDDAKAEIDTLKKEMKKLQNDLVKLKTESQVPDQTLQTTEDKDMQPTDDSQNTEGKVIKINIRDGVGAKQR